MPNPTNPSPSSAAAAVAASLPRRAFLRGILAAGAAPFLLPAMPAWLNAAAARDAKKVGQKVKIAYVGLGGQGWNDIQALDATGLTEVVALCDTEIAAATTTSGTKQGKGRAARMGLAMKKHPKAACFSDFREMLDKAGNKFDAVLVATPDFSHFPAAIAAMALGKHVYVEKPVAHSFKQIELLMAAEKKYGVATQMGNQGHSAANFFQFKTWTEKGILKNVTKINAHMNSPRRWHKKEFLNIKDYFPAQPTPEWIDWNAWLATALDHAYNEGYLGGQWRCWYDFGNGALGDWGAHIFDTAHEFLELGLPTRVSIPKAEGHNPFIFPQATTLVFQFPARGAGKPACTLTWYDGQKNLPPLPANSGEIEVDGDIPPPGGTDPKAAKAAAKNRPPNNGKEIYCADGTIFQGGTHGGTLKALDPEKDREFAKTAVPKSTSDHYKNFLLAALGIEKTRSPFSVSGPLCQTMGLGVIAQRVNSAFTFDPVTKRITDHEVADALLDGVPPRKGWEQFYKLA